ncbi:pseudouridine synthase [Butyrivibrio sp. FCS014]|uniref:pseudouridine synthase n=1 Tax=Butyrivibrio sp. FCS014 TaxID=1408304 RepID=UPI000464D2EA|nr:pseudouridine synthase [Butyrivibrio sp. FCS014]
MRLNKYIASCGVCSRREADKLIESGRITVNGEAPAMGLDVLDSDIVCLDGKEISPKKQHEYIAYYKPVGVVCTERDVHAKRTVIEDLGLDERVTYAGRLDKDSEGLLIMTDDGDLIQAMMKGSKGHEKEYRVTVDKDIDDEFIRKMSGGLYLKELDRTTRPCTVKRTGDRSFDIVLTQGLNRQIRRMCDSLGYKVITLKRIRVMSIKLSDLNLKPGSFVRLNEEQINMLFEETGLKNR